MKTYYEHARAIADELRGLANVEVVPDPPQTPLMHLHLRVDEKAFILNAVCIAEEQSIFTWIGMASTDTPSGRRNPASSLSAAS